MSAAEMSEKNLVLENELCKLKERPQLMVSENSTFGKLIINQFYKLIFRFHRARPHETEQEFEGSQ